MRTFDLSPLMQSAIGFDELFRMAEKFNKGLDPAERAYPPYNIEKVGEEGYRITMALAGFGQGDIGVSLEDDMLTIASKTAEKTEEDERQFIHRGIATRAFVRKFRLAPEIRITGANFDNGLLHVDLVREIPEHKKPRQIQIDAGPGRPVLEGVKGRKDSKAA